MEQGCPGLLVQVIHKSLGRGDRLIDLDVARRSDRMAVKSPLANAAVNLSSAAGSRPPTHGIMPTRPANLAA